MSLRTYPVRINEKTVNVKAKKDEVKAFWRMVSPLADIRRHTVEWSGVIGETERRAGYFVPLSEPATLADEAGFEAEKEAFINALPDPITRDDFRAIERQVTDIYNRHVPTVDKRKTKDEQAAENRKVAALRETREAEQSARQQKLNEQRQELYRQYPHLKAGNSGDYAIAAKNIRTELARAFPGHTFSVRSSTFSMGDSIRVAWTDGPTYDEVTAIASKYQRGNFDGMTDMYEEHRDDPWTKAFGGSKYVQTTRNLSDGAFDTAKKELEARTSDPGALKDPDIRAHAHSKSYYTPPEKTGGNGKAKGEKYESAEILINEEKGGIEVYFDDKPSEGILDILRENKFRYHRKRKFWYAKQAPQTWAAAQDLAQRYQVEIRQ